MLRNRGNFMTKRKKHLIKFDSMSRTILRELTKQDKKNSSIFVVSQSKKKKKEGFLHFGGSVDY